MSEENDDIERIIETVEEEGSGHKRKRIKVRGASPEEVKELYDYVKKD